MFPDVYSGFNPRASVNLGQFPEHTELYSFNYTVHARGGPNPSLKYNDTSHRLYPIDSTSKTGHNKNIPMRKGRDTPFPKRCGLFCSRFLFHEGKTVEERGKTWNVCGKLFQHLMEMHLLQVLRRAQRDGNKTHLEHFSFPG